MAIPPPAAAPTPVAAASAAEPPVAGPAGHCPRAARVAFVHLNFTAIRVKFTENSLFWGGFCRKIRDCHSLTLISGLYSPVIHLAMQHQKTKAVMVAAGLWADASRPDGPMAATAPPAATAGRYGNPKATRDPGGVAGPPQIAPSRKTPSRRTIEMGSNLG